MVPRRLTGFFDAEINTSNSFENGIKTKTKGLGLLYNSSHQRAVSKPVDQRGIIALRDVGCVRKIRMQGRINIDITISPKVGMIRIDSAVHHCPCDAGARSGESPLRDICFHSRYRLRNAR